MGIRVITNITAACMALFWNESLHAQQPTELSPGATPLSIEDEVMENILSQPVGPGTVADFDLPEPYLRRVADRIIQSSFEQRYRIVVKNPVNPPASSARAGGAPITRDTGASPGNPWPTRVVLIGFAGVLVLGWIALARRRGRAG